MNKYLLYFLLRLSIAVALNFHFSGLVNPRVCKFIHSNEIYLKNDVSTPTADDIKRYVVAAEFAYFKYGDLPFKESLNNLKNIFGENVVYTPFFKDGTEKETDNKKRILAGYIIQINQSKKNAETIVAFRGTKKKELSEWKNNLDSIPILRNFYENDNTKNPVAFSLWVHRGITKEYDRCRLNFLETIKQKYTGGEIVFVGHSKGVISQLGALDFSLTNKYDNRFPIHLVSFGSYKVFANLPYGNNPKQIFKKMNFHCSRVYFSRDPIVNYPYFRNCYQHIADTKIHLIQPPNCLMEHCVYNYKRFFMEIPSSKK